ncbi:Thiamine pyrophosphokinase [uncultured Clostridium sp.]|nr:Thiamine pyrophosphokinase [uncultured Clostridium sp.]
MKTAVIISGGSLDPDFALAFLREEKPELLIGADRGICFLKEKGIHPTHIVGDFDSASGEALEYFKQFPEIPIRTFNPVKDFTDTAIAMELAMEEGADRIYILGGTGTRLDHVVANIKLLSHALERKKECILMDAHNRIRLIDQPLTIEKKKQYGKYVSLFAFGGQVKGLTLRGFFYPLTEYDMEAENPLGVSNEITAENGEISFLSGKLLVMESKD